MNAFVHTATPGAPLRAPSSTAGFGATLWRWLEEIGQRRAARELLLAADRWAPFDPELSRTLRAAAVGTPKEAA